ncbi:MAG: response regulator [Pseudomonadota bacterium]
MNYQDLAVHEEAAIGPSRRVRVIDDDKAHADSIVAICEAQGYEAAASYGGAAGIEALQDSPPDVLILDLNMPGIDGIGVLRAIQALAIDTKTIVLTGTQDFHLVAQIIRLGAYDFLTKPTQPPQLLTAIGRATALKDLEEENLRNAEAAQRANALREFLVNATEDFVYVLDENGRFSYINNKLSTVFNLSGRNLQGAPWEALFDGVRIDAELRHQIAERRTGNRATREFQFQATPAGGKTHTLLCTSRGLYRGKDARGDRFTGTYGVVRDITALHEAEEARLEMERSLQRIGKMEAMGQLAGGIAHDFNNILAGILGYAELLQSAHQRLSPELMEEYLGEVVQAGHRARDLIAQMQAFTRSNRSTAHAVDMVATINSVSRMLRAAIPSTITLITEFEDNLPCALADPVQLQQIVLNLMINARDAIDGKGTIELRVALNDQPVVCTVCEETIRGPHLTLSVRDTGHGIPEPLRQKIFEMHFSTRVADSGNLGNVPGSGTGIGLWLINSLVHDYGGHITLESEVGGGSDFTVHLPVASTDQPAGAEPEDTCPVNGQLVVVDDIVSVASFIGELLRERGFDPVVFSDSQAALAHLEDASAEVGMLITDQSMPGLTGLDLIEAARAVRPALPAILITAYANEDHHERMAALGVNALLPKPFRAADLLGAIREHAQADAPALASPSP